MKRSKLVRSVSSSLSVSVLALALSVAGCAKSEASSSAPLPATEGAKAEAPASDTPNVAAAKEALAKGAVLVTGGLARDVGMHAALRELAAEQEVPIDIRTHRDSVLAGAIGAALWGAFRARKLMAKGVPLTTGGPA